MSFFDSSTAGNASIKTNSGAITTFNGQSTGGDATITTNCGGLAEFHDSSSGDTANIITNNGGVTKFFDSSTGGLARFITNSGGVVDISTLTSAGMTAGSVQGAGNYSEVGLNNLSTEVSGIIADGGAPSGTGGSLTKASTGTLTLTGENTYSGGTTISAGTLQLGNGGTAGSIIGNVTDDGTLIFNRSGDKKTFDGVISRSGQVVKLGTDTLVLTADKTYSGGTTIDDGILVAGTPSAAQETSFALGTGDVFLVNGILRTPSLDPLTINVGRNYTQGPGGTLELGVAGLDGKEYDQVQVGGNASLNGTLAVSSLNNFRPSSGNAFEVLNSNGACTGKFAQVSDSLNSNLNLQRIDVYAPNGVALIYVQAAPTPTPSPTPVPPGPSPSPTPQPSVDVEDPKPLPPVNPEEPLQLPDVLAILDPTAEQLTALYEMSFSGANSQRFKLDERFADIQRGLKRIYRVHLKSSSSTTNFRQRSNRPRESSSAGISAHTPESLGRMGERLGRLGICR